MLQLLVKTNGHEAYDSDSEASRRNMDDGEVNKQTSKAKLSIISLWNEPTLVESSNTDYREMQLQWCQWW
jgi:hypothetical protein